MPQEYYLYSSKYTKLPDWKKWNVGTIIQHPTLDILAKIGIFSFGHQIDIIPDNKNPQAVGLTNILTAQIPIKLIPNSIDVTKVYKEYEIETNVMKHSSLSYSTQPLSTKLIESFLNQEEVLFYNFDEEQEEFGKDNWIIIKWKYLANGISFDILHTFTTSKNSVCLHFEYLSD